MTKSDLNETMMNLEQSEALALNLEQAAQDKAVLQKRLQHSLEKEGKNKQANCKGKFFFNCYPLAEEQLRKVCNLEELLKRLEQSVTKLETENASLKQLDDVKATTGLVTKDASTKVFHRKEEVEKLEQQLQTLREEITVKKDTARQAQRALREKERKLDEANLDARIAVRQANKAEEKIKVLQEEKKRLQERLSSRIEEEQETSKKLLKELDIMKVSLNDITNEASRNKMQADSAQKVHIITHLLFLSET